MRFPLLAFVFAGALALAACGDTETAADPTPSTTAAAVDTTTSTTSSTSTTAAPPALAVYAEATFDVDVTRDVVYGQALVRDGWDATETDVVDLTLDVYEPVRADDATMPAVVMIHGGGFTGGSSRAGALSAMAADYAARGWVGFSINYRLAGDHGPIPDVYPEVPGDQDQTNALYPACRDAKAAIRWVKANADVYGVDPDAITVVGGSAGSFLAVTLGVSSEDDCVTELTPEQDPTLASTNLDQSSSVAAVIDHWGGDAILQLLEFFGGGSRYDATDAPVSIVHGTSDTTVTIDNAERIVAAYEATGVAFEYHPIEGGGHGIWGTLVDGEPLVENGFDFMVEQLGLTVR